jgi:hypothetical protein
LKAGIKEIEKMKFYDANLENTFDQFIAFEGQEELSLMREIAEQLDFYPGPTRTVFQVQYWDSGQGWGNWEPIVLDTIPDYAQYVGELFFSDFWNCKEVLVPVLADFLRNDINVGEALYGLSCEGIKGRKERPLYKGNVALVKDGIFVNPYQVVQGLPALPDVFRPMVKVAGDFCLRGYPNTMEPTLGNWEIIPPKDLYEEVDDYEDYQERKKRGWGTEFKFPKKYRSNVLKYIETIKRELQGVEL